MHVLTDAKFGQKLDKEMQSSSVMKVISEELSSIFSALVAGARYGAKIRLPHAFVMTFLFRRDLPASEKVKNVFNLVLEHASNLSAFAAIYKAILSVLKLGSRKLLNNSSSEGKHKHGIMVALVRTIMSVLCKLFFFYGDVTTAPYDVDVFYSCTWTD